MDRYVEFLFCFVFGARAGVDGLGKLRFKSAGVGDEVLLVVVLFL